jgi:hypothetical protein
VLFEHLANINPNFYWALCAIGFLSHYTNGVNYPLPSAKTTLYHDLVKNILSMLCQVQKLSTPSHPNSSKYLTTPSNTMT